MVKPAQSRPPAPRHARMRTPLPSAWCSGLAVVTALIVPAHAEARSDAKPSPPQAEACTLEPGPVRTVTRIIDAETIGLDDASEVRLAGAMPPRARDSGAQAGAWPLETTALSALADLVLGKSVELAYGEQKSDRYGRRRAHVFVRTPSQARVWVQGELLTRGLARAYALPSDGACLAELVAHERVARDAKAGLWAVGLYRPKRADRTALLMSLRSSFQIATGKVVAVSRTKSAVYLNFGADWRSDFSVRIAKSIIDENPDWEEGLENLKDKTIEVRGWIERRNGPQIVISRPEEIAVVDAFESLPGPLARRRLMPGAAAPARLPDLPDLTGPMPEPSHGAPKEKRPEPRAPGDVNL